ncbi:MAG: hypothetical protein CMH49_07860, partial [Myxococcales bacterium]|nr:hypothetical protein [Myxococcales bacterium]
LDRAVELLSIWQEYLSEFEKNNDLILIDEVTTLQTWLRSVSLGASNEPKEDRVLELTWEDYQQQERAEKLIERLVHDGDWMGAIQALIRLAQLATSHEQAAIWYRVGFYTELGIGDQKAAYAYYRKSLRLNPHYVMALVALRRHDLKQGDWNAYLQWSTTLTELDASIPTQEALFTHLGHLNVRVLNEEMVALDYYQKALDLSLPSYDLSHEPKTDEIKRELSLPAALKARYAILCQREEWSDLSEELERYLPELNSVAQAVVLDWLSWIYETKTGQKDLAIQYSLRLMDLDPSNTRIRRASRAQLAKSTADILLEPSSLRELGQVTSDLEYYLAFLKTELDREDSDLDQLSAYTRMAQIYERQGELKHAERYWKRAFKLNPKFLPASQGLGRAAYRRNSWRELLSLYRKELNVFEAKSPQRVELLRRLAELYEHRLNRPSSASRCYEDILSILPDDAAALASLDRLYQETGEWRSLARVWNSKAHRLSNNTNAQGAAFLRAAEHFMEAGSEEQALNAYEHAYQANSKLHPASWAIEFIMYRRQGLGRIIELYRSMRQAISLPFEKHLLTHKLILELSAAQVKRALQEELYDERDDLEVIWWQIHTAIEQGNSVAQSEGLFELAQRVEDDRDAYSLVLEAVQRLCQGRHLDRRYRDYWDRVQLTNPESRMAWWAMTEQAFRYEREPQEYRSMLARLSRVGDETRQRAQAVWLQALHEFHNGGKYRVVTELIEEATTLNQETLTPSLLRQLLSPIKGRVATLDSLNELSHRLPEGELRGDALFKLALLEAEDAPQVAFEHALRASRNHIPEAISLAEALYRHIEQGQELDLSTLDPKLLHNLLGIEIEEDHSIQDADLNQLEQLEAVLNTDSVLQAADSPEFELSFDDDASHIEFDFEDDDEDGSDDEPQFEEFSIGEEESNQGLGLLESSELSEELEASASENKDFALEKSADLEYDELDAILDLQDESNEEEDEEASPSVEQFDFLAEGDEA